MGMERAWTFSSLEAFETCPKQYHDVRISRRIKDKINPQADWGDRVHNAFESFIKDGTPLPETMTQWRGLLTRLNEIPGRKITEVKLAVDRNFCAVEYKQAWSRGKGDLAILNGSEGALFDYKTGKPKPSEQLTLYAGYSFAEWPQLKKVQTAFVWLKTRQIVTQTFHREDVPKIWQEFTPRVRRLELAFEKNAWPARPSGLCKGWCPVTDCEHYKTK
jgi:hypothetical protein